MTQTAAAALSTWWQGPQFSRFFRDVMLGAISMQRPALNMVAGGPASSFSLGEDGFDLDSLEKFNVAVAIAEALQFTRIEEPERLQAQHHLDEWMAEARRCLGPTTALGFRTSGSTGAPKVVVHDFALLAEEVEFLASLFQGRRRILSAIPAHHIYGFLFTVLLPQHLGVEVVDVRPHAPRSVAALAREGDLIAGFPGFWSALQASSWERDVTGVTSGGACPSRVAEALRGSGLSRLVEVYGSTETAGVGWRDDPDTPFALFPYWERVEGSAIRRRAQGAWRLCELPDHVEWPAPRLLAPVSRRDGAVKIGGVNVSPERVRAVLMEHQDVAAAAVRLMRLEEGERLKAFVVPASPALSTARLQSDLEAWVAERLRPLERPRSLTFGMALPAGPLGKPADW